MSHVTNVLIKMSHGGRGRRTLTRGRMQLAVKQLESIVALFFSYEHAMSESLHFTRSTRWFNYFGRRRRTKERPGIVKSFVITETVIIVPVFSSNYMFIFYV